MLLKIKISKTQLIETATLMSAVLLYVAWNYQNWKLVIAAIIVLVLSLVVPKIFYPFAKLWFGLGLLLGFVSTKLLLTMIFFLVVTPIGLFRKFTGKDDLSLKSFKKDSTSSFVTRNYRYGSKDLKNQF